MAILQISQITQRKGLQADLPQLAGAEFGWSIDERRLWIGNGTLAEGAPVVGNTEILTEFSNIAAILNYTFSGDAATGYAASGALPISYQDWLDQHVSVLDFGIVGDGITDVGDAINRALNTIYCQTPPTPPGMPAETTRRSLYFPAGVYVTSKTIKIPTYATLIGDGSESTVIQYQGGDEPYAVITADADQQTGALSGAGGIPPGNVTVTGMKFQTDLSTDDVLIVENATNTKFNDVCFVGPQGTVNFPTLDTSAGIRFNITNGWPIEQIVFDKCLFSGTTYGANSETTLLFPSPGTDVSATGVTFINSYFNILQQGIVLGSTGSVTSPSGFRIANNIFDNVYAEGIVIGKASAPSVTQLNATAHNIFLEVGNYYQGAINPQTPVITFNSSNNTSIGDMFNRNDIDALTQPRILTVGLDNISSQNGATFALGTYTRKSSRVSTLTDATTAVLFTQDVTNMQAFSFDYTAIRAPAGNPSVRMGKFTIASNVLGTLNWSDDYTENLASGITFTATRTGNTVTVSYTTTSTGSNGIIQYSIDYFA